ncbi:MAG: hypothetical protein AABW63_01120 [Nanoarchaeota archaeon]
MNLIDLILEGKLKKKLDSWLSVGDQLGYLSWDSRTREKIGKWIAEAEELIRKYGESGDKNCFEKAREITTKAQNLYNVYVISRDDIPEKGTSLMNLHHYFEINSKLVDVRPLARTG